MNRKISHGIFESANFSFCDLDVSLSQLFLNRDVADSFGDKEGKNCPTNSYLEIQ
jgi:hypothetical protein